VLRAINAGLLCYVFCPPAISMENEVEHGNALIFCK
jgi:hypothetical protein